MADDPVSVSTESAATDSAAATAPADETTPVTDERIESPSAAADAAAIIINNTDSNNNEVNDDNHAFMKDLLCSLPAMEQRELENIVQQSCQLLFSNTKNDGDNSVWKERVVDSFWMEYRTRTCRHSDLEIVPSQPLCRDTEHISHLRTQIQDYQTLQYGEKHYATARFRITAVSTTEIMLRTYVEYIDTANCSTASWQVEWTIQIVDDITAMLSGTIRLHTHYYENNTNSQMQCQQEFVKDHTISLQEEKVNSLVAQFEKNTLSYAEKLVSQIVKYIIRKEEDYYTTMIDHILCNSNGESESTAIPDQLRSLRRILPVTKQKFAWHRNSTQQQSRPQQQQQPMTIQQQMMQQMQKRKNQLPK